LTTSDTTLSIICTTHNAANRTTQLFSHLLELLGSSSRIEIVLIDDGSTDLTASQLEGFRQALDEATQARVLVHRQNTNSGVSAARNTGIGLSRGRYLCFLDDDDTLSTGNLPALLQMLDTCESDLVTLDLQEVKQGETKWVRHMRVRHNDPARFLQEAIVRGKLVVQAWAYAYKRTFIEQCRWSFPFGLVHEDCFSTPTALLRARTFSQFERPFYQYRRRAGSITSNNEPKHIQRRAHDLVEICERLLTEVALAPPALQSAIAAKQFEWLAYAWKITGQTRDTQFIQRAQQLKAQLIEPRPHWKLLRWTPPVLLRNHKHLRRVRGCLQSIR